MPVTIGRETTNTDEMALFNQWTKVLAEVPIEAVRCAAITLTDLTELLPVASITLFSDSHYSVVLFKWQKDPEISVALRDCKVGEELGRWDLEDIDPL